MEFQPLNGAEKSEKKEKDQFKIQKKSHTS